MQKSLSLLLFTGIILGTAAYIAYASTPPNRPSSLAPAHNQTWSDSAALTEGDIQFSWTNNGDAENNALWFYVRILQLNGTSWNTHTASYTSGQGITTMTKNLTAGYYIWNVAAVDPTQSSSPWHSWADRNGDNQINSQDWSFLRVKPPPPISTDNCGTANCPLTPGSGPIKTVCASGCDYATPQAAANASQPGWIIQIKNGIYIAPNSDTPIMSFPEVNSGTQAEPITVQNFPSHTPIFDCSGDGTAATYPDDGKATPQGIRLLKSKWLIIEGLEIRGCQFGIQPFSATNITIRNNIIHHMGIQAIILNGNNASDIYIADNIMYHMGTKEAAGTNGCNFPHEFCHCIYVGGGASGSGCTSQNVTIRRNYCADTSGYFAHFLTGPDCNEQSSNNLVENNIAIDTATGMQMAKQYVGNTIRNNTIAMINCPAAIQESPYGHVYKLVSMDYSRFTNPKNKWYNNIFYSAKTSCNSTGIPHDISIVHLQNLNDKAANVFDYNLWYVPTGAKWFDAGTLKDFIPTYKSSTGWDSNGPAIPTDPLFTDIASLNLNITTSSPAKDTGDNTNCASMDKYGTTRPQNAVCDIGMHEFVGK